MCKQMPRLVALTMVLMLSAMCLRAQALASADAIVAEAQARLGTTAGVIELNRPARLDGDVALKPGEVLRITAPLTVGKATVHLLGRNEIQCEAPISVDDATDLFVAEGVEDIRVRGCDVSVRGRAGGYLLTATRSARVVETDNHLQNIALFNTHNVGGEKSRTTDVSLNGNSVLFNHGQGPTAVYLLYVLRGTVSNNRFMGTGHGIEWWGGDGNIGWRGPEAVTGAGDLSITGNQCYAAGGACVWGSMGFNVTVSGNSADLCSDVCFDAEGGVRNLFTGNTAQACGNGCYSVQMEGVDVVFTGNFAYADAKRPALALFLIKHRNGNSAEHTNLTVTGNTMSCADLCTAFYSEGEGGLDLSHNTVVNGIMQFVNYTNSVRIEENSLRFSVPLGARAAIAGPSLRNGHESIIAGNTIRNDLPEIAAGSVCIAQAWSDDNSSDEMRITRNTCDGFGQGIVTETAGHNAGAPHAVWLLSGNEFTRIAASMQAVHRKTSGNEVYTVLPAP